MLVQWLFALLIAGAFNEDLEEDLDEQLTECSDILHHARDFYAGLPDFNDNRRRLADSEDDGERLQDDVKQSFESCMAVIQAVNDFYNENDRDGGVFEESIILNVGGTRFPTTLTTLRSVNDTYFEKMFRNESMATCSADGSYFIDRNPENFQYIMDFLRTGDMLLESADSNLRSELLKDAEFYELPEDLKEYLRFSSLISIDLSFSEVTWLNNQLPSDVKLGGLLMDTVVDTDTATVFRDRCEAEGATVTIIETTRGIIIGGYVSVNWAFNTYLVDTEAFIFRLRPSPEKYPVIDSARAGRAYTAYGPVFGSTAIYVSNQCTINSQSYVDDDDYYRVGSSLLLRDGMKTLFRCKNYAVVRAV